ncbi:MAG: hypothetical protein AAF563_25565 [Pseudomonadota bacterium]
MKLTRRLTMGLLAATMLAPAMTHAQDFSLEGETVTWVVPFREGGGTDRLTRILAASLAEQLPGQPNVIVLNQPGGGSVTAANAFHTDGAPDGTTLFMASTSTFLPVMLGADVAEYDPNEWTAIAGFPRGATLFGLTDQIGAAGGGADAATDLAGMRDASIRFGLETPISAEMLDLVAMELLDVDARVIFGLSSSDAEAAFLRGEMNMNTDNTLSFINDFQENPDVVAMWSYGVIDENGVLQRDPDLPDLPTFEEFYEAATGEAPSGLGYDLLRNLMYGKVMISKAVMLPAGTPDHIRQAYIDAVREVVADPEVRAALDREVGQMPVNFGDETTSAIAGGTQMDPAVREWANAFLQENYDSSLD